MNTDQDYDNDGNNIVPCPICNDNYCPSKDKGKCPEEDDFIKAVKAKDTMNEYIQEKNDLKDIAKKLQDLIVEKSFNNRMGLGTTKEQVAIDNLSDLFNRNLETLLIKADIEAYNRGVEDSLACVPEELEPVCSPEYTPDQESLYNAGSNSCRQQTIDNINKLKTNK